MALIFHIPTQFPKKKHHFLLPASHGQLEIQTNVEAISVIKHIGILCHPHPRKGGGGTMHNKVITTMDRFFRKHQVATIRFNFRGVGQSTGTFSNGVGEVEDLLTVLEWVRHLNLDMPRITLAGFSFGSFVTASIANFSEWANLIQQVILVAPPVERFNFNALNAFSFPFAVIQGESDTVVNPMAVKNWFDTRKPSGIYCALPEVEHFFHQKLDELTKALTKVCVF